MLPYYWLWAWQLINSFHLWPTILYYSLHHNILFVITSSSRSKALGSRIQAFKPFHGFGFRMFCVKSKNKIGILYFFSSKWSKRTHSFIWETITCVNMSFWMYILLIFHLLFPFYPIFLFAWSASRIMASFLLSRKCWRKYLFDSDARNQISFSHTNQRHPIGDL